MRALSDELLTGRKMIYWLHYGAEPNGPLVQQLQRASEVTFVPIADADLAMLQLWSAVPDEEGYDEDPTSAFSIGKDMLMQHLIAFPPGWWSSSGRRNWPVSGYRWFNPTIITENGQTRAQDAARLDELRRQLLPILRRLEELDKEDVIPDCAYSWGWRRRRREDEMDARRNELTKLVPVDIPWTRRNRTFLRLALDEATDLRLAIQMLATLCTLDPHRRAKSEDGQQL